MNIKLLSGWRQRVLNVTHINSTQAEMHIHIYIYIPGTCLSSILGVHQRVLGIHISSLMGKIWLFKTHVSVSFQAKVFPVVAGPGCFLFGAVHWNYPTYPPARHHVGNPPFQITGHMQPANTFRKKPGRQKNKKTTKVLKAYSVSVPINRTPTPG